MWNPSNTACYFKVGGSKCNHPNHAYMYLFNYPDQTVWYQKPHSNTLFDIYEDLCPYSDQNFVVSRWCDVFVIALKWVELIEFINKATILCNTSTRISHHLDATRFEPESSHRLSRMLRKSGVRMWFWYRDHQNTSWTAGSMSHVVNTRLINCP